MTRADFLAMTPPEFDAAVKAHNEDRHTADLGRWHRLRTLAAIVIRPHVKKAVAPEKLIPLAELDHRAPASADTPPTDPATLRRLTAAFADDLKAQHHIISAQNGQC